MHGQNHIKLYAILFFRRGANETCVLFGILRNLKWWLFTDVSGLHIGPIFEDQVVQEETTMLRFVKSPKVTDL